MAWMCLRCNKRIFAPREHSISFVIEWKYKKTKKILSADIKNLKVIKERATITHVQCKFPEVDGFDDRLRKTLKIPADFDHPLLL